MNKEKVQEINKEYNYNLRFFNDTVYITSKNDEWYAFENNIGEIVLYHKNKGKNKNRYHKQRAFVKIEHMFDSIYQHDTFLYKNKFKEVDKIRSILKKLCI